MEKALAGTKINDGNGFDTLKREVLRHSMLLDGNSEYNIVGLRDRVHKIECAIEEYRKMKLIIYGILVGLGLNVAGIGAILVEIIRTH